MRSLGSDGVNGVSGGVGDREASVCARCRGTLSEDFRGTEGCWAVGGGGKGSVGGLEG